MQRNNARDADPPKKGRCIAGTQARQLHWTYLDETGMTNRLGSEAYLAKIPTEAYFGLPVWSTTTNSGSDQKICIHKHI